MSSANAPHSLIRTCLRGAIAYVLLVAIAYALRLPYAKALVTLSRWDLQSTYLANIEIGGPGDSFQIAAVYRNYYWYNGRLWPIGTINRRADVDVVWELQHLVVALLIPLAWPSFSWRQRAAAVMCAVPLIVLEQLVDSPLQVLGQLDAFQGYTVTTVWYGILKSGGSITLSAVAGLLACSFVTWTSRHKRVEEQSALIDRHASV